MRISSRIWSHEPFSLELVSGGGREGLGKELETFVKCYWNNQRCESVKVEIDIKKVQDIRYCVLTVAVFLKHKDQKNILLFSKRVTFLSTIAQRESSLYEARHLDI